MKYKELKLEIWGRIKANGAVYVNHRQSLLDNNIEVHGQVDHVVEGSSVQTKDGQVFELFVATTEELTGHEACTLDTVLSAIRKRGYELCPVDLVSEIRIRNREQPCGETINVAMDYVVTPKSRGSRYYGNILQLSNINDRSLLKVISFIPEEFDAFPKKWLFVLRK
jgi:hypothetical protein